jgi:hypothetical protein
MTLVVECVVFALVFSAIYAACLAMAECSKAYLLALRDPA